MSIPSSDTGNRTKQGRTTASPAESRPAARGNGGAPGPDATDQSGPRFECVFIDNEWRAPSSGKVLDVYEPATGQPFARIAAGDARDIASAVTAARAAFEGPWGKLSALDRGRLLSRMAGLMEEQAGELTRLEARDTGKPMSQARADIDAAIRNFEFYGAAADKVHGRTIPFRHGCFAATEYVPHGVTGHIIPWNYPAQMFGRTLAPSLAMGNATVLKPAEDACLTTLRLAELTCEAGFPPGAVNVVPGRGEVAGAALSAHRDVGFVAFTGSPEVGTLVQIAAARRHAGCTLELGGKSPQIVFADADLEEATGEIVRSIVLNAGQTCSAGSRVLVQDRIADEVAARLSAAFSVLRAGPPEQDLDLGPVISPTQKRRVERFCGMAEADGIPLIGEGRIAETAPPRGWFVTPRVYGPVPPDHPLAQDEVFGPVLALMSFSDETEAVRLANGTGYGLVAGIWSANAGRALRVARQMRAGQVYVNGYGIGGAAELPFGGVGKSGHGREKGLEALMEFAATRTLVVNHG